MSALAGLEIDAAVFVAAGLLTIAVYVNFRLHPTVHVPVRRTMRHKYSVALAAGAVFDWQPHAACSRLVICVPISICA